MWVGVLGYWWKDSFIDIEDLDSKMMAWMNKVMGLAYMLYNMTFMLTKCDDGLRKNSDFGRENRTQSQTCILPLVFIFFWQYYSANFVD